MERIIKSSLNGCKFHRKQDIERVVHKVPEADREALKKLANQFFDSSTHEEVMHYKSLILEKHEDLRTWVDWFLHPSRRIYIFKCYSDMLPEMFESLPPSLAEPAAGAFIKRTGSYRENLMVSIMTSSNDKLEMFRMVEMRRAGACQTGLFIILHMNNK